MNTTTETGLVLRMQRPVKPTEIVYLVLGTGALSYPWWAQADVKRLAGVGYEMVADPFEKATETDVVMIRYDDPSYPEGSGQTRTRVLSFQEILDAVGRAILKGYVYEKDAIAEDLGLCDAEQADIVLQLAVFGGDTPVYG